MSGGCAQSVPALRLWARPEALYRPEDKRLDKSVDLGKGRALYRCGRPPWTYAKAPPTHPRYTTRVTSVTPRVRPVYPPAGDNPARCTPASSSLPGTPEPYPTPPRINVARGLLPLLTRRLQGARQATTPLPPPVGAQQEDNTSHRLLGSGRTYRPTAPGQLMESGKTYLTRGNHVKDVAERPWAPRSHAPPLFRHSAKVKTQHGAPLPSRPRQERQSPAQTSTTTTKPSVRHGDG